MSAVDANQPSNTRLSIYASVGFDSPEAALEHLVELKEVDFGEVFTDRETELESEDSGISIQFYHDEHFNLLSLSTDEDDQLLISLSLVDDAINQTDEVINTLLASFQSITIERVQVDKRYEIPFRTLSLPIAEDSDLTVTGVRIQHQGWDCIIQESDDSDGDLTLVTAVQPTESTIELEVTANFGNQYIQDIDQFIVEVSE